MQRLQFAEMLRQLNFFCVALVADGDAGKKWLGAGSKSGNATSGTKILEKRHAQSFRNVSSGLGLSSGR